MITRRGFIKTITTAAGLMILDPSALIEQVGTTFYSFPPEPTPAQIKSMVDIIECEYNRLLRDLRRDINRQLWGDGFNQFAKTTHGRPKGDGYIFKMNYSK